MMDYRVAACCLRSGAGSRAQVWLYQRLIPMLTLSIVLLLGSYPSLSAQATVSSLSTTPRRGVSAPIRNNLAPKMPEALSTALAFNIFVIGDLVQRQSITYGRIAVGGN